MASESTSSQQSQQLLPSSKVNFRCEEGIIAFNNAIALLEHPNKLYRPMLKVKEETKTITFSLSWWDKPLSFTQDEFISAIGLPIFKDVVPLPPKETVRAGLATLASEVPLTSHMLKVAKLSEEPEQSLIPPSGEVNADDTADKSLSRASVVILPKKQVAETQHAEVKVATADATQSLEASESAEEQVNQPRAAEAKMVLDQKVEETVQESGFVALEDVTFDSSYDKDDQDVIDITPKDVGEGDASESLPGLRSMPDDDLASMTSFKTQDSADHVSEEGTETLHASTDMPAQSDPLSHLHEELYLLNNKVNQLESSITKHVSDSIQSTVPLIVTNTLKEQLPEELPQVEAQVQKNLQDKLPNILLKPMYKEFNVFNKLESQRFVLLQKELSKFLHNKMRKSIRLRVRTWMKEVCNKLSACTSTVATNSQHVLDLRLMFHDMVSLLSAAEVFQKANAEGEKWEKKTLSHLLKKKMLNTLIKLRGSNHQLKLYQM
ncbi:hypothetical protein Tco_1117510 [Tanacetum coccineum]